MGGAAIVDSPVISVDDDTILGRWLFFFFLGGTYLIEQSMGSCRPQLV